MQKTITHEWKVTPSIAVEVNILSKYDCNIRLVTTASGESPLKWLMGTKEIDTLISALQEAKELVDGKK